jgi:hypothetical protein
MKGDCRSSTVAYLRSCGRIKHLCDRNYFALASGTKSAIKVSPASPSRPVELNKRYAEWRLACTEHVAMRLIDDAMVKDPKHFQVISFMLQKNHLRAQPDAL